MGFILGWDPETLRENVDLRAIGERLQELGGMRSLAALSEKASLLCLADQLDEALATANQALRQARFTGDRETAARARVRRASVLRRQGKTADAVKDLSDVVAEAATHEWRHTEALARAHRAGAYFDAEDLEAAAGDLRTSADLQRRLQVADAELENTLAALEIVEARRDERRRLGVDKPARPTHREGPDAARHEPPRTTP
ncbi:MAG TPA: tetratricopeptide repeat protein [Microbacteriaceae bacterium]|nr:tetratricopeptide repeat protein [Microbacteriaceae bacterium]